MQGPRLRDGQLCYTSFQGIINKNRLEFFHTENLSILSNLLYLFNHLFVSVWTQGYVLYIIILLYIYILHISYIYFISIYYMYIFYLYLFYILGYNLKLHYLVKSFQL